MIDNLQEARVFTDIHGLQALKRLGRNNNPAALQEVSRQFESFFLNTLLKSIRASNDILAKDNYTSSSEVQFYQQSFDQQLSLELSKENGTGLAELIYQQLSRQFADHLPQTVPDNSHVFNNRNVLNNKNVTGKEFATHNTELPVDNELPAHVTEFVNNQRLPEKDVQSSNQSFFNKLDFFNTPFSFVKSLYQFAKTAAERIGLDPKVLLAQSALETGWGKYVIRKPDGESSHNLFGIKADQRWNGDKTVVRTLEYRDGVAQKEHAAFRSYGSFEQSFDDYIDFLQSNDRYKNAVSHCHDARQYTRELQAAGYATDPDYAEKIQRILDSDLLNDAVKDSSEQ